MGRRAKEMTGLKFGKLTVIRRHDLSNGVARWFCHCECGGTAIVQGNHLRGGRTTACGCRRGERDRPAPRTQPLQSNRDLWQSEITYRGAHERVYALRGKVKNYRCVDCGECAYDWSLRRDAPVTYMGSNGCLFSADPLDYEARCRSCHIRYDRETRLS